MAFVPSIALSAILLGIVSPSLSGFQRDLDLHRIGHIADNVAFDHLDELRHGQRLMVTYECELRFLTLAVEGYHIISSLRSVYALFAFVYYTRGMINSLRMS
jgi:hypothetical protein